MTATLKLSPTFDGEVTVGTETVLVHNAIAQTVDVRDADYRPSSEAVLAAQMAVDAAYRAANGQ